MLNISSDLKLECRESPSPFDWMGYPVSWSFPTKLADQSSLRDSNSFEFMTSWFPYKTESLPYFYFHFDIHSTDMDEALAICGDLEMQK